MVTGRAQSSVGRLREWRGRRHPRHEKSGPSWIERRLDKASPLAAFVLGAVINLPGPLYLLGLGRIATGGYGIVAQILLVLLFNAVMFLLLEVPLVGYVLWPEATRVKVSAFGRWLNANGLRVMGALVGLFGASFMLQGVIAWIA